MVNFSNRQIEMIWEMSDIHFQWFTKYTSGSDTEMTFADVIKLNHQKMIDISLACSDCSEDMIDFIFEAVIRDYKDMLDNYSDDFDDFGDFDELD
jgi:hypothetical protein